MKPESQTQSNNTVTNPLLITARNASDLLGIAPRRLWALTNSRAIPSRRIGRSVRYAPIELAAWVALGCPVQPGAGDRVRKVVAR